MRPWTFHLLPAAIVALLAGCAGVPTATDRVVPSEPPVVRDRVVAELRSLGLAPVVGGDGVITARASQAPGEWAGCSPALVGRGGSNNSKRMVSVRSRQAVIHVALVPVGADTKVEVTALFTARYDNPETASNFERACRSKGVLEARLLAAAGG